MSVRLCTFILNNLHNTWLARSKLVVVYLTESRVIEENGAMDLGAHDVFRTFSRTQLLYNSVTWWNLNCTVNISERRV